MQSSSVLPLSISERQFIATVAFIQFVNILDFMMVMPLGPDFARALSIPAGDIGLIGGAYTFAAAISGLIAALFLDQFSRKRAIIFCLCGLSLATFAGAIVWDKHSMIAVRLIAGLFGGPLTSLTQALIADYIPPERRGQAMGKVAGSFAAASVLGVPFGLELASRFSWHAPFIATGIMALGALALVMFKLPYHVAYNHTHSMKTRLQGLLAIIRLPMAQLSYAFMGLAMMSGFMIIPNLSAHLQFNMDFPRAHLGLLYLAGGFVSFFSMRIAGRMVDKTSATYVVSWFTTLLIVDLALWFVLAIHAIPSVILFTLFMVCMSGRMVCAQTLSSKVPDPSQRGAYMSVQSAVTHFSSALGAYYSSLLLTQVDGRLNHMDWVGITSILLSCCIPILFYRTEQYIRAADAKK